MTFYSTTLKQVAEHPRSEVDLREKEVYMQRTVFSPRPEESCISIAYAPLEYRNRIVFAKTAWERSLLRLPWALSLYLSSPRFQRHSRSTCWEDSGSLEGWGNPNTFDRNTSKRNVNVRLKHRDVKRLVYAYCKRE